LETILLEPYPCGTDPCIDSIFGPTASSGPAFYWSSSTIGYPTYAWLVGFSDGIVITGGGEAGDSHVRAVRGGS
jgi:hypothetical protein